MSVEVGYLPRPAGRAALRNAIHTGTIRHGDPVVVLTLGTVGPADCRTNLELVTASLGRRRSPSATERQSGAPRASVDVSYKDGMARGDRHPRQSHVDNFVPGAPRSGRYPSPGAE